MHALPYILAVAVGGAGYWAYKKYAAAKAAKLGAAVKQAGSDLKKGL